MIFLRILSFMAGSFVLFAAPVILFGQRLGPPALAASALITMLFALVYFYFALQAHRMGRSARLRHVGAALLAFQLVAGGLLLGAARQDELALLVTPLLCFSVCLLMAFVWPGELGRSHRPMRARSERGDKDRGYLGG